MSTEAEETGTESPVKWELWFISDTWHFHCMVCNWEAKPRDDGGRAQQHVIDNPDHVVAGRHRVVQSFDITHAARGPRALPSPDGP